MLIAVRSVARAPDPAASAAWRRRAHALQALARLQPGVGHAFRSDLGAIAVSLDVGREHLERSPEAGPESRARVAAPLERARRGLDRLERLVAGALAGIAAAPSGPCDLAGLLRDLDPLLAAGLREHRLEWRLEAPEHEVRVSAGREPVRDAIAIVVAARMPGATPGPVLARLTTEAGSAVLVLEGGAPAGDPEGLEIASETLAALGGALGFEADGARVRLEFPRAGERSEPLC